MGSRRARRGVRRLRRAPRGGAPEGTSVARALRASRRGRGRAQALTSAEVWRTRLETSVTNWRTRSRLDEIGLARGPALQELGTAVRSGDRRAANEASKRLDEIDEQEWRLGAELELQSAQAKEKIRLARLPVQETVLVAPEPSAPYPPPDEGNPPTPAIVPEQSPPPDEADIPELPDPGDND